MRRIHGNPLRQRGECIAAVCCSFRFPGSRISGLEIQKELPGVGRDSNYWRANLRLTAILLLIWFLAGFAAPILGIEWLNQFRVGNLGAGFWMAQQGSIIAFVLIVLVYALLMDRLDRRFGDRDQRQ